jgi:hypothetical protein
MPYFLGLRLPKARASSENRGQTKDSQALNPVDGHNTNNAIQH